MLDAKSIRSSLETDCVKASAGVIAEMEALKQGYLDEYCRDLIWIKGAENPADPATKIDAPIASNLLEDMFVAGRLPVDVDLMKDDQLFEEI